MMCGMNASDWKIFRHKMQRDGLTDQTIGTFKRYYEQLCSGETGIIAETDIEPVLDLPSSDSLAEYESIGIARLSEAVVIKLNGGLGTSMGMTRAKSLLQVKDGNSFLDIICQQIIRLRRESESQIPLVLMNSVNTRADTMKCLAKYPDLKLDGIPLDFLQTRVPKVRQDNYLPVEYSGNSEMEWNPPGHGDIYNAMSGSGCLRKLLDRGYKYAFISNSDNLGAELDPALLGYFADRQFSFMMEVARRTPADRKGGHLARHTEGHLILREVAQCAVEDQGSFQDIDRYRYFNTNSIWINLIQLDYILKEREQFLNLPLIRNSKTVDPRDPSSTPVYQVETAMGAAISCFDKTAAVCVPRRRFLPVKTTNDLIGLWSDAYVMDNNWQVRLHPERSAGLLVKLDPKYYKLINQLEERFPHGAPSLLHCNSWNVTGDFSFSEGTVITGNVKMVNDTGRQFKTKENTVFNSDFVVE